METLKHIIKESGAKMTNVANKEQGMLAIESKNIFTILKKWLYEEQDIVFRELVSNATDAIEKLAKLHEADNTIPVKEGKITVKLDVDNKQLIISDNGIGMTSEEVHKYINQIAFSGAEDFVNNNNDAGIDTIIGHFGVGFYSSFMLADHVALETKSYKTGAEAVRWDCTSDMAYQMVTGERKETGTDVILYLNEGCPYLDKPESVRDIIKKYFVFSRTAVYFEGPEGESELLNNPNPVWRHTEDQLTKENMNVFYKDFFDDVSDPLFWIQFESIDIGVRGVLFFRDTKNGTEELDGTIKVYNRGVYVGDNIKSMIPKFVNLQSGIIECDNLPLVVSRSQIRDETDRDEMLGLIYECLSQEVTIAFNNMFVNDRPMYETNWPNLNAFVKYAVLQDKVFASVMTKKIIFKDTDGAYQTIPEYVDNVAAVKHPETIYYASDATEQAHYIEIFKKCGLTALLFDHVIDQPFMRKYETVRPNLKFVRIDSNIESLFEGYLKDGDEGRVEALTERFHSVLGDRLDNMTLKVTNLKQESISTLIINDEQSRRMADMLEIYGFINPTDMAAKKMQAKSTLLINLSNDIVRYILTSSDNIATGIVINQLFDLALMSQQALKPEDVEGFINRSEAILAKSLLNQ